MATGKRRTKCRFNQYKAFFWKRTLGECETCPTDLAAPPAGVSVTCGFNALNRKKCHYKCESSEKLQFSTGEALQFSAICACPRWNGRVCGWHARKLGGMITDADISALSCGGNNLNFEIKERCLFQRLHQQLLHLQRRQLLHRRALQRQQQQLRPPQQQ